jgi:hypothetical protein
MCVEIEKLPVDDKEDDDVDEAEFESDDSFNGIVNVLVSWGVEFSERFDCVSACGGI